MKSLRAALSALLAVTFVTLFATGCGNSREDFVITNNNQVGNGTLVFRFQQAVAQAVDTVPAGTTQLRFDLFSTNPGTSSTLVLTETRAFAEVVTLTNVPTNVVFVAVTALGADGLPTQILTSAVTVSPGSTIEVDLGNATPVTFDDFSVTPEVVNLVFNEEGQVLTQQLTFTGTFSGEVFNIPITTPPAEFVFNGETIGNISATGLLSVGTNPMPGQNTTVTASYTFLNTTLTDDFDIRTFIFDARTNEGPVVPTTGTYSDGFRAFFVTSGGQEVNLNNNEMSYALETAVSGVSIDSTTGVITTTSASPGTFNVVVTFVDSVSGLTFTDLVEITIADDAM